MELEKIETPAVREVAGRAQELQVAADQLKVVDGASDYAAKELLSEIRKAKKRLEELRQQFVAPLNQHVKKINAFFKQAGLPLETGDEIISIKMKDYFREQREKAEKEQERQEKLAAKRQETADAKAREQGEEAAPPVMVSVPPPPQKTVRTDAGTVTMREDWDFEVEDEAKIPREYLTADTKKIREAVELGIRNIPGVRIFKTVTPVTRPG